MKMYIVTILNETNTWMEKNPLQNALNLVLAIIMGKLFVNISSL